MAKMKVQVCVQVYRSKRFSITNKGLALLDSGSICALLKMILEFWEPFQWDPFWLNILIHPADVISMFSFPLPWWQLPEVLSIGCGCQRQEGPFALQEDSHFDLSASQNKVQSNNFSTSCNIGLMQLIVYSLTLSLRWIADSFFQTWNTQKSSLCDYFDAQEESTRPNCYAKRVCRR